MLVLRKMGKMLNRSSKDASTDDDDDDDFLVDEEDEIIKPDVDVYLFGISMDLPFDNIGVTNLVSDDVLEGENVDVINPDGFDSDPGNVDETNDYRRRRVNPDILVKAVQDQLQRELEAKYWQLLDFIQTMEFTHWHMPWLKLKVRLHEAGSYSDIISAIIIVFPNAEYRYCLRHIHENMKQGWCGQAYKDLLWRAASVTSVKEFEKRRAKSDLLLNNMCEVFNGKIVGGRDKPEITLLEYIREYCMKRIMNVQGVIDKFTSPLTPSATRIMDSIKK
ncbi:hypothetical protein Tco_1288568 [Tanacetum coccineum]